jgi:hypothetical protein
MPSTEQQRPLAQPETWEFWTLVEHWPPFSEKKIMRVTFNTA